MVKAVIFDLDGVVADSHPLHEAAWKTLLVEEGMDSAALNLEFLYAGHPRREILRHYLGCVDARWIHEVYPNYTGDPPVKSASARPAEARKHDR